MANTFLCTPNASIRGLGALPGVYRALQTGGRRWAQSRDFSSPGGLHSFNGAGQTDEARQCPRAEFSSSKTTEPNYVESFCSSLSCRRRRASHLIRIFRKKASDGLPWLNTGHCTSPKTGLGGCPLVRCRRAFSSEGAEDGTESAVIVGRSSSTT